MKGMESKSHEGPVLFHAICVWLCKFQAKPALRGIFGGIVIENAHTFEPIGFEEECLLHSIQEAAMLFFKCLEIVDIAKKYIDRDVPFLGDEHIQPDKVAIRNRVSHCLDNKGGCNLCRIQAWEFQMIGF
jgi:hypothetical protein